MLNIKTPSLNDALYSNAQQSGVPITRKNKNPAKQITTPWSDLMKKRSARLDIIAVELFILPL
ncbi:MAG: hypothetical protein LZF61_06935 [Nitrosomonas sp.]|nr:MAG: hypothetical protein LZF61_06935 [Nitrosomonas sp.]